MDTELAFGLYHSDRSECGVEESAFELLGFSRQKSRSLDYAREDVGEVMMKLSTSQGSGRLKAHYASVALAAADIAALPASVVISVLLRFDDLPWSKTYRLYLRPQALGVAIAVTVCIYAFSRLRLYKCAWRFAGLEMLWAVVLGNTIGIVSLALLQFYLHDGPYPASVLVTAWTLGVTFTGGFRIALRAVGTARHNGKDAASPRGDRRRKAVILGGGANGARILGAVREDPDLQYDVIGFLDDDPAKKGVYIQNVKVLGPLDLLGRMIANREVDEVIVAIPNMDERRLGQHVIECRRKKVAVKLVPQISDVLNGRGHVQLVDFEVEDLLRRSPEVVDLTAIGTYLTGKRVLVTGAGGSIGSELCRQIISMNPASLVMLGHGENSIHQVHMELLGKHPHLAGRLHYAIASVAHQPRIDQVFREHKPEVVFHAAAHKHVPMMETNEQEAVRNNVIGTYNVAQACGRSGVKRIVLISTDKAADPCCVMGVTKRLCEEILRCASELWPQTSFMTVRFGNVLGSRGSVVSIFRKQIKHGGPVTITHPEMTRYFMTIPEAVRLVLEAGAVGSSGEVYLLEMGKPVKVLDLARDMIRLSGYEPGVDIAIEFTGIRPGEKIHERLTSSDERIESTPWGGLSLICRPTHISPDEMLRALEQLEHTSNHGTPARMRRLLGELVPGCECRVETQAGVRESRQTAAAKVS